MLPNSMIYRTNSDCNPFIPDHFGIGSVYFRPTPVKFTQRKFNVMM